MVWPVGKSQRVKKVESWKRASELSFTIDRSSTLYIALHLPERTVSRSFVIICIS